MSTPFVPAPTGPHGIPLPDTGPHSTPSRPGEAPQGPQTPHGPTADPNANPKE
jgi:hypothetical protein